ncbi:AhpC/TSA family protein [Saccharata proteae CBS 121410]|uniref:AhpC/TSA family protein n=1 Tax=Saccharata proteae CBS 121410 TaxID=1314787 RepID=A0A9P4HUS4_9PEZI|nr:AhpC/TSA family protein [Saccharata proteae CBS 121410]
MFARRLQSTLPRINHGASLRQCPPATTAAFHASSRLFVRAGDALPNVDLVEGSPGNKVNIAKELQGKGLIIGVPAAYSPACSESHIPGYINSPKLKDAGSVFVVSVNDPFVMKAWGKVLDPTGKSGIRFVADPASSFTDALDLSFDGRAIFGNMRSKRYALVVEDGKVKEAHVEPDNTGMQVSTADKVLA